VASLLESQKSCTLYVNVTALVPGVIFRSTINVKVPSLFNVNVPVDVVLSCTNSIHKSSVLFPKLMFIFLFY
jgi:hypothetical protein